MNPLEEIPSLSQARGGVFYLHGEDALVRALIDNHLDPGIRDFNLDPLRGTEVDTETLASVLATPPMMAEWRVVVIREVEGLASSSKARNVLLETVASPPPGLALILSCTVPSGSKAKFYKDLAKKSRAVEFRPLTPDDVPGWLMERAQARGDVELDVDAAQALGAAVGTDLGILSRELEKLVDFVGDRRRIRRVDVEAAGTRLPSQDRWRWFDLVGEGRLEEALESVGVLLSQGENGVGLTIGLATLESALPARQRWLANRLVTQAKRWQPAEIEHALEGLLRLDRLLKASPVSHEHLLEEWLLGLLAARRAA